MLASRAVDKCRASLAGTLGEIPLRLSAGRFALQLQGHHRRAIQNLPSKLRRDDEEVGAWLQANGTAKTPAEIKTWSDEMEATSLMKNPEKRAYFIQSCSELGLNPQMNTTFDWLEADDRESFRRKSE